MRSAKRTIVLSPHLLAASHLAAMVDRSSGDWKEAHLSLVCRTHVGERTLQSALRLRVQWIYGYTGKLEQEARAHAPRATRTHGLTPQTRTTNQRALANDWSSARFRDETAITGAHRRFADPRPAGLGLSAQSFITPHLARPTSSSATAGHDTVFPTRSSETQPRLRTSPVPTPWSCPGRKSLHSTSSKHGSGP